MNFLSPNHVYFLKGTIDMDLAVMTQPYSNETALLRFQIGVRIKTLPDTTVSRHDYCTVRRVKGVNFGVQR